MGGSESHVPAPKMGQAISKLAGTLSTLRAGDVWAAWFDEYARHHRGWKRAAMNPILLVPWNGEPFQVKGEQCWPGAAVSKFGEGEAMHIGQAARWQPALAGSGNAMHPTWVGSPLVFAMLADGALSGEEPFSLVRADKLKPGARMLAATSISKFKLNHGLVLGRTGEGKVRFREGVGVPSFHLYAPAPSTLTERSVKALSKALSGWHFHVRFQQGVFLTWGWQGKAADRWEAEADDALAVLSAVREAVFGVTHPSGEAGIPATLDWSTLSVPAGPAADSASLKVTHRGDKTANEPVAPPHRETMSGERGADARASVTLRYSGQTRRNASTGAIEVLKPPKLRLPRGYAGTILRWLVSPGETLDRGQPVAIFRDEDGAEVELCCPRIGHRVVRRIGLGAKVHDRSVIVSLERVH